MVPPAHTAVAGLAREPRRATPTTPRGNPFPIPLANKNLVFPTQGVYYSQPLDLPNSYTQQWNLSIQRQLGDDWSVDLSYLGNKGTHIWADRQANPVIYVPGNSTTASAKVRLTVR